MHCFATDMTQGLQSRQNFFAAQLCSQSQWNRAIDQVVDRQFFFFYLLHHVYLRIEFFLRTLCRLITIERNVSLGISWIA